MVYGNYSGGGGKYAKNNGGGYPTNSTPRSKGTTSGPDDTSYGPELINQPAGKFMELGYFKTLLSIAIGTVQPGQPIDWQVRRNTNTVKQFLTFHDLVRLEEIIGRARVMAQKDPAFGSIGFRCGTKMDAHIEISDGSRLNMAPGVYLVLYQNLDSSGRSSHVEYYPFMTSQFVQNFDPTTGEGTVVTDADYQLREFYRVVKEAASSFTEATSHTIRRVTRPAAFGLGMAAVGKAMNVDWASSIVGSIARAGNANRPNYAAIQQNQVMAQPQAVDMTIDMNAMRAVPAGQFG